MWNEQQPLDQPQPAGQGLVVLTAKPYGEGVIETGHIAVVPPALARLPQRMRRALNVAETVATAVRRTVPAARSRSPPAAPGESSTGPGPYPARRVRSSSPARSAG